MPGLALDCTIEHPESFLGPLSFVLADKCSNLLLSNVGRYALLESGVEGPWTNEAKEPRTVVVKSRVFPQCLWSYRNSTGSLK